MAQKILNPIAFVKRGYDQIAATYHAQRNLLDNRDLLEEFVRLVPPEGRILGIGCGAGVPVTKFLLDSACTVIGIDLSREMLALARTNVPNVSVVEMNMVHLAFQAQSFDGLSAFYTIFHIPRTHHHQVFAEFARMLKPGGVMLISLGWSDWEGTEGFHGTEMYWSHYPAATSVSLLMQAGLCRCGLNRDILLVVARIVGC
jgi:ubiquinone/menaquinone biosynthesis C-methylase UbiE